ncbi:MAG TPA: aminotransferase class V-fold PLP-dependent enzyme [Gammaproteobacteria bacterium]|nr:aminotransferase class V-fold PLP-dependent enzyme [Gammaproteobacteria bacterium]
MNPDLFEIQRPPTRVLLGPGPSELDPEVLRAMTLPPLGYVDPAMLQIFDELKVLLREAFQTTNDFAIALSGTGTSGMQAALCNTIEAGDPVVIGTMGYFGERLASMAERLGAKVTRVDAKWGAPLDPDRLRDTIRQVRPRVVGVVHGETSTGVAQNNIADIAAAAHELDALLIVDTVASLGGHPIDIDAAGIDVCYSGSQKALGAPAGMAPLTLNERAMERVRNRKSPVASFYLDVPALEKYWYQGQYHHTISAPLVYALRAALLSLHHEGPERRWTRHQRNYGALRAAVEALGLKILAAPEHSLHTVAGVLLPDGVDAGSVQKSLLNDFGIEVATGLGPFKPRMLRVGLMGYGSQPVFVLRLLAALESVLRAHGHDVEPGTGLAAAQRSWHQSE